MAAAFHVSQLSSPPQNGTIMTPSERKWSLGAAHKLTEHEDIMSPHHGMQQHRMSLPGLGHPMHINPGMFGQQEVEPQLLHQNGYTHTPPDVGIPITPVMPHMPQMDHFVNGNHFDQDHDSQYLSISSGTTMMDFDASTFEQFMSPPSLIQDINDQFVAPGKGFVHSPFQMTFASKDGTTVFRSQFDVESPQNLMAYGMQARPSPSTSSSLSSRGLQEPDAVVASHQSWPFFQCNIVEKSTNATPKTAAIYLEGLAQTLKNHDTWEAWTAQLDQRALDHGNSRQISSKPIEGYSREKLLAITQSFLHKALDIHKAGRGHRSSRDNSPGGSPDSGNGAFLMLPPPDVMQYFLKTYVVRYEPYYSSIPGALLDPNQIMQSANYKAASLLILLMVASGAASTPTVEARYLASGLTEACRISLFDTIEKDISQAREPLVLRSALLFTTLAAWSGDKWHMDIAMGQRGMYLAMLAHADMLEAFNERIDVGECQCNPESAWEEWKEYEAKNRLASSWIIVDQEISLFSDTTPLLAVVNMHSPTPDAGTIWEAGSATDWLAAFEKVHGTSYSCPPSVRELFGRFVDGELPTQGQQLSPTQLRLLLHPLQAQVCQLRQFISCLPDGGSRAGASRGVSRAQTKARLEEISALLQHWYTLSQQCSANKKGPCWTTTANLIIYHLISLNAITSFKCIEQFARREVVARNGPNSWLQTRCIDQSEETIFHCGQVLRLINSMPNHVRPPWWAGAVYRVAITGWANSMANMGSRFVNNGPNNANKPFPVDALVPEHESISRYLKYQEGVPMLSKGDGQLVPMDVPSNILNHCIDILDGDCGMRLTEGIKLKLRRFATSWKES
jgi:hypothetical protein